MEVFLRILGVCQCGEIMCSRQRGRCGYSRSPSPAPLLPWRCRCLARGRGGRLRQRGRRAAAGLGGECGPRGPRQARAPSLYTVTTYTNTIWADRHKKEKRGDAASARPLQRQRDLPATLPVGPAPALSVLFPRRRLDRSANLQVPFPSRLPRQQDASTQLRPYDAGRPLLSDDKPAVCNLLIKKG
jgi:hypothetical protein